MSGVNFGTAFLMMNMGAEMVYILEQRLRAQEIPQQKAERVIQDVVKHMFNEQFVDEMFRGQPLYSMQSVKTVFNKLAHSSIMKLQEASMAKLFDLMLMGVKQQFMSVKFPEEIVHVTLNHLETVCSFIRGSVEERFVQSTMEKIRNEYESMPTNIIASIRQSLLTFFQERRIKVSIFLQDGLQLPDGTIVINSTGDAGPGVLAPGSVIKYDPQGKTLLQQQFEVVNAKNVATTKYVPRMQCRRTMLGQNLYSEQFQLQRAGKPIPEQAPQAAPAAAPQVDQTPPDSPPKGVTQVNKARADIATWELNSLADMIAPSGAGEDEAITIDLFASGPSAAPRTSAAASRTPLTEEVKISAVRNDKLESIERKLEGFDAPGIKVSEPGKQSESAPKNEEDELLDLLDDA